MTRTVRATLDWIEENLLETRGWDPQRETSADQAPHWSRQPSAMSRAAISIPSSPARRDRHMTAIRRDAGGSIEATCSTAMPGRSAPTTAMNSPAG